MAALTPVIKNPKFSDLPDDAIVHALTYLSESDGANAATTSKVFARCTQDAWKDKYNSYSKTPFLEKFTKLFDNAEEIPAGIKLETVRRKAIREIVESKGLISPAIWNEITGGNPLSSLTFRQIELLGEVIQARRDRDLIRFFNHIELFQPKIAELDAQIRNSNPYQILAAQLAAKRLPDPEITQELERFTATEKARLFREYLGSEEAIKLLTAVTALDHQIFITAEGELTDITCPIECTLFTHLSIEHLGAVIQKAMVMGDFGFIKQCWRNQELAQRLAGNNIQRTPFYQDNHPFLAVFLDCLENVGAPGNHFKEAFKIVRHWPEFQFINFSRFRTRDFVSMNNIRLNLAGQHGLEDIINYDLSFVAELIALRNAIRTGRFDW